MNKCLQNRLFQELENCNVEYKNTQKNIKLRQKQQFLKKLELYEINVTDIYEYVAENVLRTDFVGCN